MKDSICSYIPRVQKGKLEWNHNNNNNNCNITKNIHIDFEEQASKSGKK